MKETPTGIVQLGKAQMDILFARQRQCPEDENRFVGLVGAILRTYSRSPYYFEGLTEIWNYAYDLWHQYRQETDPTFNFIRNRALFHRILEKNHIKVPKPAPEKQPRMPIKIYEFEIVLKDTEPPIWRRFAISGNIGLKKLHDVIQVVMGWTDSHLHQFNIDGKRYCTDYGDLEEDAEDESYYRVRKLVKEAGEVIRYEYDFWDFWEHELKVLKTYAPERGVKYPICVAGERACPPEDVGGVFGYEKFLEIIADPKHEDHEHFKNWVGGSFDSEAFDIDGVNRRLRKVR